MVLRVAQIIQISDKRPRSSLSYAFVGFVCSSKLNIARMLSPWSNFVEKGVAVATRKSQTVSMSSTKVETLSSVSSRSWMSSSSPSSSELRARAFALASSSASCWSVLILVRVWRSAYSVWLPWMRTTGGSSSYTVFVRMSNNLFRKNLLLSDDLFVSMNGEMEPSQNILNECSTAFPIAVMVFGPYCSVKSSGSMVYSGSADFCEMSSPRSAVPISRGLSPLSYRFY